MDKKKKIGKFFVTGTDTDCGKTLVTQALLYKAKNDGYSTLGLKPVSAGAEWIDGELKNSDAILLQQQSTVSLPYAQVNPIVFEEAIAPHIAASMHGKVITAAKLEGFVRGAMITPSDLCLIEGAGGWQVPINHKEQFSLLPKKLSLDVILVVGMKLGCINHALLTAQAIRYSGLKLAGWVANQTNDEMAVFDENLESLKYMIDGDFLGVIPYLPEATAEKAAEYIQLPNA